MVKQRLEQRQEHSLNLSPAQIQAIKLVELTGLELEGRIERELVENPALEEGTDQLAPSEETDSDQDWELGEYADEDDIPTYKLRELQERQTMREEILFASATPSLEESLMEQLSLAGLSEVEEEVARYIVGNINLDGYLLRSAQEIQDDLLFKADLEVEEDLIEGLIDRIRALDPAGVGARDLQDCLLLQLRRMVPSDEVRLSVEMITKYYEDFANKRFDRLVERLGITPSALAELYGLIARLNPRPGRGYGSQYEDRMQHYTPDFIVTVEDGELVVELIGERETRPLRLSPKYAEMLQTMEQDGSGSNSREARDFVRSKLEQARWFIDAIAQRQDTLRRTMRAIADYQRAFFMSGDVSDLRPMILKDISQITALDISTISRVCSSKSVQCDYGVYPLKYFFGEGVVTTGGEEVSTRSIKQRLQALIDTEDKRAPYTDEELTTLLAGEGYPLSRRTVAKYREQLRLPVARLRREL